MLKNQIDHKNNLRDILKIKKCIYKVSEMMQCLEMRWKRFSLSLRQATIYQ